MFNQVHCCLNISLCRQLRRAFMITWCHECEKLRFGQGAGDHGHALYMGHLCQLRWMCIIR
jgi:hypothetical protein